MNNRFDELAGLHCYIASERGQCSQAYFISDISILNTLDETAPITWQPESFLKSTSTLGLGGSPQSADKAFETLLWNCAQSGLNLLDEAAIKSILGDVIDQAQLDMVEQRQEYRAIIEKKYGEAPEAVIARLPPSRQPQAAVQLANEIAQAETNRRMDLERHLKESRERENAAIARAAQLREETTSKDKELSKVEKYRQKLRDQQERERQKANRSQPSNKRKSKHSKKKR